MDSKSKVLYLTFDMDWINDGVLEWFNNALLENKIRGTINVTHDTVLLNEFRKNNNLELGIHPNFNRLLLNEQGRKNQASYKDIIIDMKKIVPEAISVRSHSLVKSNMITKCFFDLGLKYESNIYIDPSEKMRLVPFTDYTGMWQVPIIFEDDLYLNSARKRNCNWYLQLEAGLVFNFHPIHLFLNTEHMNRYENAKKYTHDYQQLNEYKNNSNYGIWDFFMELISLAKKEGFSFGLLREIDEI